MGMKWLKEVFGTAKPVIAMVHLPALPGTPLYDQAGGIDGIVDSCDRDLEALQLAGVDAVMFGNENDRPYQLQVDTASTATMAYVVGRLAANLSIPFGVNVLWDPQATIAVAAATKASFAREIYTGVYASDMGLWTPDAGAAARLRRQLGCDDLKLLFNINAEFAQSLDPRPLVEQARSVAFSSLPDAVLVSGQITGEPAGLEQLVGVKEVLPDVPVLANTGVRRETVAHVLDVVDGVIVATSLKVDGDTWKPVDPARAKEFMDAARQARGS